MSKACWMCAVAACLAACATDKDIDSETHFQGCKTDSECAVEETCVAEVCVSREAGPASSDVDARAPVEGGTEAAWTSGTEGAWTSPGSDAAATLRGCGVTGEACGPETIGSVVGGFAFDDGHVYWASGGLLTRLAVAGGSPETIATGGQAVGVLGADGSNVYVWVLDEPCSRQCSSSLAKVPVGGGIVEVASGIGTESATLTATQYLFLRGDSIQQDGSLRTGGIAQLPLAGGSVTTLVETPGSLGFVVQGNFAVWVSMECVPGVGVGTCALSDGGAVTPVSSIWKAPIDQGAPVTAVQVASGLPPVGTFVADATNVYWVDYLPCPGIDSGTCAPGTIKTVPLDGGSPTVLASGLPFDPGPGLSGIQLAVDADNVYWVGPTSDKSIHGVPKRGGTAYTLAFAQWNIWAFTFGATDAYWIDGDPFTGTYDLRKVPLTGGDPMTLASLHPTNGPQLFARLRIHDSGLYWTDGSFILRLPLNCENGACL